MTRDGFEMSELELRRMLRDLRDGPPAPTAARARLRVALDLAATNGLRTEQSSAASRSARSTRSLATRAARGWMLGGLGATALVGAWLALGSRPGGGPSAPAPSLGESRPVPHDVGSAPDRGGSVSHEGLDNAVGESAETHAAGSPTPPSDSRSEKRPSRDSSLATERRLLDAARAALAAGDPAAGMDKLNRHARQFSHGFLAEERDALLVDGLVATGRYQEARRRADVFRSRYPESLFAPSIAAALRSIP